MASATRPRTPTAGKSSSPAVIMPALPMPQPPTTSNHPLPSASSSKNQSQPATANVPAAARRSSLGILLRRSKSNEFGSRKRAQVAREQELLRQQQARNKSPPRLPQLYNGATPPRLQTFGGDHRATQQHNMMSSGRSSMDPSAVPVPPIPASIRSSTNGDWVDPYARAESMTHRGRYSYASSHMSTINSPRRVRRRKDPTPFK